MPLPLIGAAIQAAGSIINPLVNLLGARHRKKEGDRYLKERGTYQVSKNVLENQALAKNELNARSSAAKVAEGNIAGAGANAFARAQRSATSSASLLAAASGIQAGEDNSLIQLDAQEAADRAGKLAGVMNANQNVASEEEKAFNDRAAAVSEKYRIRSAAQQSSQNAVADLGNNMILGGDMLRNGGFNGLFNARKKMQGPQAIGTNPDGSPHFG